jgi:putative phage-type endonuclease
MSEELIQGSVEWLAARCGKVTASRIADVCAKTKTGWGASRVNYMAELLTERLTGNPAPSFTNDAMRWGTEQEPQARAEYAFRYNVDVAEVGFIHHPKIAMSGASPDGLVGEIGLVEFKCPNTATHVETLLGEPIADKYIKQMQWQMACCDRSWCDWVSFDPRLPEHMQLFVQRVPRDDRLIAEIEQYVTAFLEELDAKLNALRARYEQQAAA